MEKKMENEMETGVTGDIVTGSRGGFGGGYLLRV